MAIKITPRTIGKVLGLLVILGLLSYFSKKIREKDDKLNAEFNSNSIDKYLLEHTDILKSSRPVLWIHVPRELNARRWQNFGSPNSEDLNQPYIYLTVRSIIEKCGESFTICIIDDDSFAKLLPGWEINLDKLGSPILENVRTLGCLKLLYLYGGLMCPKSFLCQKDLVNVYNMSISKHKMIAFEKKNQGISAMEDKYVCDLQFCATFPQNETVKHMTTMMEELISSNNTHETQFVERIGMTCKQYDIHQLDGKQIGIKKANDKCVILEDLMTSDFVNFATEKYGILIPEKEILKRRKFEWFASLNSQAVLTSETFIGKQLLLTLGENTLNKHGNRVQDLPNDDITKNEIQNIKREEMEDLKERHVGFWKTPSGTPVWGLKPNHLGDHLDKL